MRNLRHSITVAVLAADPLRHPAYAAARQLADLAHPEYEGLYNRDAAEVAAAVQTIRRRVAIPGQLGELFNIAAAIADEAWKDEDIRAALQRVARQCPPYSGAAGRVADAGEADCVP